MKCVYCRTRAGIVRKVCPDCAQVVAIVDRAGGAVGLVGLVDIFATAGLTRERVDRVLDAAFGDTPTIRDRLTSEMANALMRGLGMPGRQSPDDVRRVRTRMAAGAGEGTVAAGGKPSAMELINNVPAPGGGSADHGEDADER
jgi:hypothetical protein